MVKEAVHDDATDVRVSPLVSMNRRELISMILVGVAAGAIISVLYFLSLRQLLYFFIFID